MYCKNCGNELKEGHKFCTNCGMQIGATSVKSPDLAIPQNLKKFSWGAFGLGWIYFWQMKYKKWGWILLLQFLLNGLAKGATGNASLAYLAIDLVFLIAFGIEGRKIAWQSRAWRDEEEFRSIQKKWDIWGIVIFILIVAVETLVNVPAS